MEFGNCLANHQSFACFQIPFGFFHVSESQSDELIKARVHIINYINVILTSEKGLGCLNRKCQSG